MKTATGLRLAVLFVVLFAGSIAAADGSAVHPHYVSALTDLHQAY